MRHPSDWVLVSLGIAALAVGVWFGHTAMHVPPPVELAVKAVAGIYAFAKVANDLSNSVFYSRGVTNSHFERLQRRDHAFEMTGVGLIVTIGMMHSTAVRTAALVAVAIVLVTVGTSGVGGRDVFDPWVPRICFAAIGGFALTFIFLGLRIALRNHSGHEVAEHYEYALGGLVMLSFLLAHRD